MKTSLFSAGGHGPVELLARVEEQRGEVLHAELLRQGRRHFAVDLPDHLGHAGACRPALQPTPRSFKSQPTSKFVNRSQLTFRQVGSCTPNYVQFFHFPQDYCYYMLLLNRKGGESDIDSEENRGTEISTLTLSSCMSL